IPRRLRHDYFARWMLNPQRIDPRTMMPPFAPEGKSPLTEFYGGDGVKQFDALWHYMKTVP
ncbi:MAG: hypothetical protein OER86_02665, partial [Phycisphaerae bacterium]|nr:hypothetical protein [Phycisphaerae bacterium]